ncbi:hypothetical protein DSO57_1037400 [Entomophthora muscae]|uniref:Uncharacterized protein n=3 Tax=Entomophthora muscae TaxID=34485 RepID=A0ACC2TLE5_9FUNG|nr:hypothetical protein DSO57_1037400 [Entomophthora muscae]
MQTQTSKYLYCSCLNIRISVLPENAVPSVDKCSLNHLNPDFQWSLLTSTNGVAYEHKTFVSRHRWDENWIAVRCLNCDMDVYAWDTTDSIDLTQTYRPILSCIKLKTEEEARKVRMLTTPEGGSFYSPAFKIRIFPERPERKDSSREGEQELSRPTLLEFQSEVEETLKTFTKHQETAMQLKIEEFREEQRRNLQNEINSAKIAAKYLLQSTRCLTSSVPTFTQSQRKPIEIPSTSTTTPAVQDNDSDLEDFGQESTVQACALESGSEDFGSSFNDDIFDLDEDTKQPDFQSFSPSKTRVFAIQEEDTTVGSFASQGRYFPTKAPKFVPVDAKANLEDVPDDDDFYVSQFATSMPIPINNHTSSIHFNNSLKAEAEAEKSDQEDIGLIASKTYSEEKEKLFGRDSKLLSSNSMAN